MFIIKAYLVVASIAATCYPASATPLAFSPVTHPPCLTSHEGKDIAAKFASLISAYTPAKADVLLVDDLKDSSDSVNTLAGRLPGQPTFSSKAEFEAEQEAQGDIPLVLQSVDAVTCDTVVLKWTATFGLAKLPVRGITILGLRKIGGGWKVKTIDTEFNSLVYLLDIGGNYTMPAGTPTA